MRSDRRSPVAIIGGGFSGTILAAQLGRRGVASILIEGSGRAGQGVAYSTIEPAHLLNVRAEAMSAWADAPHDFAEHFEALGGHRRGFASRQLFGEYLRDILRRAEAAEHAAVEQATAVRARRDGGHWLIELSHGGAIRSDALVLATGNQEPEPFGSFNAAGDRYVNNPWGAAAQRAVEDLASTSGDVLLIGTGLTMVDLVLSLEAAGHRGRIVALSRRGLIPRAHADYEAAPVDYPEIPRGSLPTLVRWLRRRSAEVGWRAAVDSLRSHSHPLWQSLSLKQQRQFLRHARPWWDVHRHRIAPEVAQTLAQLIADGRLEVVAGRVVSARAEAHGLQVEIRRRGAAGPRSTHFDYAFNCTGPLHALERTRDPLLLSLLEAGAVRPDWLGIGLDIDARSRAMPAERLWAMGPLTKGRFWEIVAVPDIRVQANAVAEDIARELADESSV